jgi:hypothetical protein
MASSQSKLSECRWITYDCMLVGCRNRSCHNWYSVKKYCHLGVLYSEMNLPHNPLLARRDTVGPQRTDIRTKHIRDPNTRTQHPPYRVSSTPSKIKLCATPALQRMVMWWKWLPTRKKHYGDINLTAAQKVFRSCNLKNPPDLQPPIHFRFPEVHRSPFEVPTR